MNILEDACNHGASVVLFGSINRPSDYSPFFSDVNTLIIGDYRVNLVYGRYSIIVTDSDSLMNRCLYGDPLCLWIIGDSRLLCGKLPDVKFTVTTWTLNSIKQRALDNVALMYENLIMGNSTWSLNNAYHAVKLSAIYLVIYRFMTIPPLSDEGLSNMVGGAVSELLMTLHNMRRGNMGLYDELTNKVANLVGDVLEVRLPQVGEIRNRALGNPYAAVSCDNYGCTILRSSDEEWDIYYI